MVQRSNWQELGGRGPNNFSFEGELFGICGSGFYTAYEPGKRTRLHRHPYPEIFVVVEGVATFVAGDETLTALQGDVVVVPANIPHRFEDTGDARLLVSSFHSNGRIIQENLDPESLEVVPT